MLLQCIRILLATCRTIIPTVKGCKLKSIITFIDRSCLCHTENELASKEFNAFELQNNIEWPL